MDFPFIPGRYPGDCGVACLRMIAQFRGISVAPEILTSIPPAAGLNLAEMKVLAEKLGLHAMMHWWSLEELESIQPFPAILMWRESHFLVCQGIVKDSFLLMDPDSGQRNLGLSDFIEGWIVKSRLAGVAITFS